MLHAEDENLAYFQRMAKRRLEFSSVSIPFNVEAWKQKSPAVWFPARGIYIQNFFSETRLDQGIPVVILLSGWTFLLKFDKNLLEKHYTV